jgi:hypothetical protein
MRTELERIAEACDMGANLGAFTIVVKLRTPEESERLRAYQLSPEFASRAAAVRQRVNTEITLGRKLFLPAIAYELDLPEYDAFDWLHAEFGINIDDVRR